MPNDMKVAALQDSPGEDAQEKILALLEKIKQDFYQDLDLDEFSQKFIDRLRANVSSILTHALGVRARDSFFDHGVSKPGDLVLEDSTGNIFNSAIKRIAEDAANVVIKELAEQTPELTPEIRQAFIDRYNQVYLSTIYEGIEDMAKTNAQAELELVIQEAMGLSGLPPQD